MLKMWGESICKPLEIIAKSCVKNGKSLNEWKKSKCYSDSQEKWQVRIKINQKN